MGLLELDHEALANKGVGTYDLGPEDGDLGCDLCVRGHSYCNSDGCAQDYLPQSGQLEITHSGEPGSPFRAELSNVVFKQYKVEGGKYVDYAKGYQWCMGNYGIDVDVPPLSEAREYLYRLAGVGETGEPLTGQNPEKSSDRCATENT